MNQQDPRPILARGLNGQTYAVYADGRAIRSHEGPAVVFGLISRFIPVVSPRTAKRCQRVMAVAAVIMLAARLGIMFGASALGNSSMSTDQKAAIVMGVSAVGILAVATLLVAIGVSVGQSVKRATTVVTVMFILLCGMVILSYQPLMDLFMYVLAHTQH